MSSIFDRIVRKASDCGANGPGGHGFQPGNKCAAEGSGTGSAARSGISERDAAVYAKNREQVLRLSTAIYTAATGGDASSAAAVVAEIKAHPEGEAIARLANLAAEHRIEKWAAAELQQHNNRRPNTQVAETVAGTMQTFSHRVPQEYFEQHKTAVADIVAKLPEAHAERVASSVREITVAANTDEVFTYIAANFMGSSEPAAGAYVPRTGQMVLDGVEHMQKALSRVDSAEAKQNIAQTIRGLAAHEIAHAIDGEGRISGSQEWQSAWNSEGKRNRPGAKFAMSDYGRTSPEEGFAEYVRLVHEEPEKAIRHFPSMWNVYKASGEGRALTPAAKPEQKRRSIFDRLFSKSAGTDARGHSSDDEPEDRQPDIFGTPIDGGEYFPIDTLRIDALLRGTKAPRKYVVPDRSDRIEKHCSAVFRSARGVFVSGLQTGDFEIRSSEAAETVAALRSEYERTRSVARAIAVVGREFRQPVE
ncbi:MAG: hypothetical protein E6Q97_08965 [Desulfurellales bacterium]|nr:MAG: hypothetical protein E6Q97_08965 [Desulfurellales bacterium]